MSGDVRPTPGDLIHIPGYGEPREVARVLLTVESADGPTRFLVESKRGAWWTVIHDGERWIGAPLPADPDAARKLGGFIVRDL
jgi:hypothetical protein